jgi:hypothetical protein
MKRNQTLAGAIAQRLCLCGSGFKCSYAMVGSSGNDHSIVVDRGDVLDASGLFFSLLVLHEFRRTGRQARLVGILRKRRLLFLAGSYFHPSSLVVAARS